MLPSGIIYTVCQMELEGVYPVADFLESLVNDTKSFGAVVDGMRRMSDPRWHGTPNTTKLKGDPYKGIFELRMKCGNRYLRLPFIFSGECEAVLMFGEIKKKAAPTPTFMNRARAYRDKLNSKEANYEPIDFTQFDE